MHTQPSALAALTDSGLDHRAAGGATCEMVRFQWAKSDLHRLYANYRFRQGVRHHLSMTGPYIVCS